MAYPSPQDQASPSTASPPTAPRVMLPLDAVRATYVLIGLNVLVFLLDLFSQGMLFRWGALVPGYVLVLGQVWRLVVAAFLHAGAMHILVNQYAFRSLGSTLERYLGVKRFLLVYAFATLGSSVLVTALSPLTTPTVGASGAIMGVLGALLAYFRRYRDELYAGRQLLGQLGRLAIINLAIGLLPGISMWGHLGGFVSGFVTGHILLPSYSYDETHWPQIVLRRRPVTGQAWLALALTLVAHIALLLLAWVGRVVLS